MLPICSATPSYSLSFQIPLYGGLQPLNPFQKELESRCIVEDVHLDWQCGIHSERNSYMAQATKSAYYSVVNSNEQSVYMELPRRFAPVNEAGHLECNFTDTLSYSPVTSNGHHSLSSVDLRYVENYDSSSVPERLMDLTEQSTGGSETLLSTDVVSDSDKFISTPGSINVDNESLGSTKASISDLLAGINESFNASINDGENSLQSSFDSATSFVRSIIENATRSVDNAFSEAQSAVDQTGELANKKFTIFSNDLAGITSKAPAIAIDVLRRTIIAVESSLTSGASYVVYLYGSAKELFPPGIRDAVNSYEAKATEILRPIGSASQEIYKTVYSLEKSLGLDPNDPIVPFVVLVGSSATLWAVYRWWAYGGYAGDLPPNSALDLLSGNANAALIDIRNEAKKDGIPDLRRAARFRYASITPLEVDGSLRNLLKNDRDLQDSLIAAVIRNLKIVKDSSKVIVMDADGSRSKGIARSLRKIGIKASLSKHPEIFNPYLVQGGFQSWVKQGLRTKELKPETALTVLNEPNGSHKGHGSLSSFVFLLSLVFLVIVMEAEAILEDLSPTPLQIFGFGVALLAVPYALLEWEKTLQLIGVLGLSLTIYQRVTKYEDAEDLKQDVRLLLTPVRLGAEAISWAAGKVETNRIGLPTSPSSLDVQNRVLQAAAKHESQPSDAEAVQDPTIPESTTLPLNENA
ncbi:calcium sensing receptor, chloroplastic isoform X1 [Senna tora]|uniref:Calcium sensing receptor, chloroplastic isoform X1 n=1 Tax=Senna tora TaxID=362788 RepID=A0A834X2K5_9FABA|nr:calcium sensing receptor, chloroplastic isoform X1 [Senna tora]